MMSAYKNGPYFRTFLRLPAGGDQRCPGSRPQCHVQVFTWGNGANYQLGTGGTGLAAGPMRVDGLRLGGVAAVSAAKFHSAAVTAEGQLLTWGWGRGGRLGALMRPLKSTSAGYRCCPSAACCSIDYSTRMHVAARGSEIHRAHHGSAPMAAALVAAEIESRGEGQSMQVGVQVDLANAGLQFCPGRRP